MRTRNALTIVLAISMTIAAPLSAGTDAVWDTGNLNNDWGDPDNWVGGVPNADDATATFDETGTVGAVDIGAGAILLQQLILTGAADEYDIGNNSGTLLLTDMSGSIAHSASGANTISGKLSLSNGAINVTNGQLNLTNTANTMTNTTVTIGAGAALQVDDNSNLGDAGSTKVIVHGGAALSSTNWTSASGFRTVELAPGAAVTIDAQAGSTNMALQLEPLAVSTADIVKTGDGKASITSGLALLGSIYADEGALEIGADLLCNPPINPGNNINIADGAILQTSGTVNRVVVAGGTETGVFETNGDLLVVGGPGGFDFQGLVRVSAGHEVVIVDPDTANLRAVTLSGGSTISGKEWHLPNHTGFPFVAPEGQSGLVYIHGYNEVGGTIQGGDGPDDRMLLKGDGFVGNSVVFSGIVRGNFASVGVDVLVTGWDDTGWSPVHQEITGATLTINNSNNRFEIEGQAPWVFDGIDRFVGGGFDRRLAYDSTDIGGAMGTILIDTDMLTLDFTNYSSMLNAGDTAFFEIFSTDPEDLSAWGFTPGEIVFGPGIDEIDPGNINITILDPNDKVAPEVELMLQHLVQNPNTGGWGVQVPEPGTLALLTLGGIGMVMRRRRAMVRWSLNNRT